MTEIALGIPFSLDSTGNLNLTTDQSVIWSNRVRSAVGTIIGERVMRPTYGTKIATLLFDTVSAMEESITNEVARVFSAHLPLLTLNSVDILHDERDNVISAEITYSLPNNKEVTTVVGNITVTSTTPPYEEIA